MKAIAVGLAISCTACVVEPPVDERDWALSPAEDLDPDPNVVEVDIVAAATDVEVLPGHLTRMWTFNGHFPGPLITAKVGDRVVVHVKNALDEGTTVHWHGLRVPAAMAGVPAMQEPIAPGSSFTYDFVVKDALLAWYHPHLRSEVQVERGLQAPFVVRGQDARAFGRETIVVIDDILLDDDGDVAPFDASHMGEMQGRLGNTILVNGHRRPVLDVRRGEPQVLRLVNSANARTMLLRLPDHQLTWLASDGGPLEEPRDVDALSLAPGERADVRFVVDDAVGSTLDFEVAPAKDGMMSGGMTSGAMAWHGDVGGDGSTRRALQLRVIAGAAGAFDDVPAHLGDVPVLGTSDVVRTITFTHGGMTGGMMGSGTSMGYGFDGERWPDVTPLKARVGTVERWMLDNQTPAPHPFHLHGNRFQVVDGPGDPFPRVWKDDVLVPSASRVEIDVDVAAVGRWMFHCHILEHAEGGMMSELDVGER